jgi:hypothetical protein
MRLWLFFLSPVYWLEANLFGFTHVTLLICLLILKYWIKSPLSLRWLKAESPRYFKRSEYSLFYISGTNFVALLWNFSILSISVVELGFQTDEQYSRCGQIYVLFNLLQICLFQNLKVRLNVPRALEALNIKCNFYLKNIEVFLNVSTFIVSLETNKIKSKIERFTFKFDCYFGFI